MYLYILTLLQTFLTSCLNKCNLTGNEPIECIPSALFVLLHSFKPSFVMTFVTYLNKLSFPFMSPRWTSPTPRHARPRNSRRRGYFKLSCRIHKIGVSASQGLQRMKMSRRGSTLLDAGHVCVPQQLFINAWRGGVSPGCRWERPGRRTAWPPDNARFVQVSWDCFGNYSSFFNSLWFVQCQGTWICIVRCIIHMARTAIMN